MSQRRGGITLLAIDGRRFLVKGSASYNLGRAMREAIIGQDAVHGYKETPQVAFVECTITDTANTDLSDLATGTGKTLTLVLPNGKTILFQNAYAAGEWGGSTEEGEISLRYEAERGEELAA